MPELTEPTLVIDEQVIRRNIKTMAQKADRNGLLLKPHVKTHQSILMGHWMQDYGIEKITVSSVKMAEYFAGDGWDDITIAFPFYPAMADRVNRLAEKATISILISSSDTVPDLGNVLTNSVKAYVEIDTGSGRTGYLPSRIDEIEQVISKINNTDHMRFTGFYSHPGHSYQCRGEDEIRYTHNDVVGKMQQLKVYFESEFPEIVSCVGDTPCCSIGQEFTGIDEISPGNFVFYDLMQTQIGSCTLQDIGIALACPVAAVYPKRQEIVVHCGAVHLSKETMQENGHTHFGKVVLFNEDLSWSKPKAGCYLKSISQEHGIINCRESFIEQINSGDFIGILPVHSCLTADGMRGYFNPATGDRIDHLQASNI